MRINKWHCLLVFIFLAGISLFWLRKVYGASEVKIDQVWLAAAGDGPYYLNNSDTTYILQNDVICNKSCFAITAKNVAFDLNGHTIAYDNTSPIAMPNGDFENGNGNIPDDWDMSSAPNAARNQGTYVGPVTVYSGNYALKFSVPAGDQQIRSLGQITLQPNTTYSISAMIFNNYRPAGQPYQSDAINLFAGLDDGTMNKTASRTGITWRGFQRIEKVFTTGSAPENYYVKAGITGAGAAVAGSVYIDDIRIQKHASIGVVVGPASWRSTRYPDLNKYGTATGAVIKNGAIIQGSANGDWSHAIMVESNSDRGFKIHDLDINVSGANTRAIDMNYMGDSEVYNNTITSRVNTINSRDSYDGASIYTGYGGNTSKIYNNVINSGIQTGIFAFTDKDYSGILEIYNNQITLQTKYTNDFAITLYRDNGSVVHNNVINCGEGNNSCRGIGVGGNSSGAKIYDNTVSVQQLKRNQEYGGCEAYGAYGIQIESSIGVQVYGNTVAAYSGECDAAAMRINILSGTVTQGDALIHNNTFRTSANNQTKIAAAIRIADENVNSADIRDNIFITNRYWLFFDGHAQDLIFTHNTFKAEGILDNPFRPLQAYNWDTHLYPEDVAFLDNIYPDDLTKEMFADANFIKFPSVSLDQSSSFYYGWPVKISVKDNGSAISGALVSLTNANRETVYSGLTDAEGKVTASLYEFKNKAGIKTSYNPYTISVSSSGYNAFSQQVDVRQALDLIVSLNLSELSFSDTVPPVISNGSPTGTLASGTTQVNLSLSTDENAICKYSISANTVYASMGNTFSTTGAKNHLKAVTGLSDGNSYTYYVKCIDQNNNSNTADYAINFSIASPVAPSPSNQAPSVNAGSDQTITLPTNQVSLAPTITDDNLPNPPNALTYQWAKISGSGTVTFADSQSKNTTASFSSNGTYVLRITANDSALLASDEISIVVNPAPSSGGGGNSGGGSGSGEGSSGGDGGSSTPPADTTAPSAITKINATNVTEKGLTLNWTSPGDDKNIGQAKEYEIRYSTSPITSQNWNSATKIGSKFSPKTAGNNESLIVNNLSSDKTYYFSIRTKDDANNWSEISSIASAKTLKAAELNTNNTESNTNSGVSGTGTLGGCQAESIKNLYGASKETAECVSIEEAKEIFAHNETVALNNTGKRLYMEVIAKSNKALSNNNKYSIAEFIHAGTETTKILGSGERAGVINSYISALSKVPETSSDWQDVIKIANGRWPAEKNETKEKETKEKVFIKIYKRTPNMNNANDNAAVTIITYGLRPVTRNVENEKAGICSFKGIYGYNPVSAADWDIVRAIAYSGAKR